MKPAMVALWTAAAFTLPTHGQWVGRDAAGQRPGILHQVNAKNCHGAILHPCATPPKWKGRKR